MEKKGQRVESRTPYLSSRFVLSAVLSVVSLFRIQLKHVDFTKICHFSRNLLKILRICGNLGFIVLVIISNGYTIFEEMAWFYRGIRTLFDA